MKKNEKTKSSVSPGLCPFTKEKCNDTECADRMKHEIAKLEQIYEFYGDLYELNTIRER